MKAIIYKQLARLLSAGIPLNRALKILSAQTDPRLLKVSNDIEGGQSFSESMFKNGFLSQDNLYSFRAAEDNSCLEEVLLRTAALLENKEKLLSEFKKTLIYPAMVFGLSILSLFYLLIFVLPAYSRMFSDFNFKLPLITRIAIKLPSLSFLFMLIFIASAFLLYKKSRDFNFRIKIPLIGRIYLASYLRDFCFSMDYQLKSGLPLVSALRNAGSGLKEIKPILDSTIADVESGEPLSQALAKHKIFKGILPKLLAVGEESGSLSDMMHQAGEHFGIFAESEMKKLSLFAEPLATLVVGCVVCFVAAAMLLPLFSMVNSLL